MCGTAGTHCCNSWHRALCKGVRRRKQGGMRNSNSAHTVVVCAVAVHCCSVACSLLRGKVFKSGSCVREPRQFFGTDPAAPPSAGP